MALEINNEIVLLQQRILENSHQIKNYTELAGRTISFDSVPRRIYAI